MESTWSNLLWHSTNEIAHCPTCFQYKRVEIKSEHTSTWNYLALKHPELNKPMKCFLAVTTYFI